MDIMSLQPRLVLALIQIVPDRKDLGIGGCWNVAINSDYCGKFAVQLDSDDLRNYVMGMGFLLLNIFLGLLGTFWFRTQQRRSEIALHKVHGASDMSIFTRLISEGLLLLLLVTPVALFIDYNLASMELNSWRNGTTLEWERLLLCAAISFLLIGLMIAIGIGIPARRAMKVQPAEALHDE